MKTIITNNITIIQQPTAEVKSFLEKELAYVDKAKQYQARRMAKSPFLRNSAQYHQAVAESKGTLLKQHPTQDMLIIPTGLTHILDPFNIPTDDKRTLTGKTVPLPWVNKAYNLRDYQEEAVNAIENNWRGLIKMATGLGKTLVAVHAIKRCRTRSLVICPTDSIAKQFYETLTSAFGSTKVGFYGGGKKKVNDITVGIAASIYKNADVIAQENWGLVIVDEVHHIAASTFYSIAQKLGNTGKLFGLTATDYRTDGKDVMITAGCGKVLVDKDIKWGVKNGWLAEPIFIVRRVNTVGKDYRDDKIKNYKAHVLNNSLMNDFIVKDLQNSTKQGKHFLCLVDEVAHGEALADKLNVPFATGKDKASQDYVDSLNKGKIAGLVGTDGKVGEGTDTQRVDVLALVNFAASKGAVMQAIGRGLRKYPGKESCIILDYIPEGSTMLKRHAMTRVDFYREITDKVIIV